MEIDEITGQIVDTALRVHRQLGPGLLESVYETVLAASLTARGLAVERQRPVSFEFEGLHFEDAFRVDLLVKVVVELKSAESIPRVAPKQLLTYLRPMDLRVGLLINFGAATLRDGLRRIVNHHDRLDRIRLPTIHTP